MIDVIHDNISEGDNIMTWPWGTKHYYLQTLELMIRQQYHLHSYKPERILIFSDDVPVKVTVIDAARASRWA